MLFCPSQMILKRRCTLNPVLRTWHLDSFSEIVKVAVLSIVKHWHSHERDTPGECPSPREGPRPKHSGPWGKSALCLQGVDCLSDHCHIVFVINISMMSVGSVEATSATAIHISFSATGGCLSTDVISSSASILRARFTWMLRLHVGALDTWTLRLDSGALQHAPKLQCCVNVCVVVRA